MKKLGSTTLGFLQVETSSGDLGALSPSSTVCALPDW